MGLSDRLAAMKPKEFGKPCSVSTALNSMPEDDRAGLEFYMYDPARTLSNTHIIEGLQAEGYNVKYSALSLHRRKNCRCFTGKSVEGE